MESAGEAQTNRKVTHVEKCGLARVESAADLMGQPIDETVGQLMNTDTSWITSVKRRGFARFVLYFGRLLIDSSGEVCPKEAVFLFRVLARGVGARLVIALICGCVG